MAFAEINSLNVKNAVTSVAKLSLMKGRRITMANIDAEERLIRIKCHRGVVARATGPHDDDEMNWADLNGIR